MPKSPKLLPLLVAGAVFAGIFNNYPKPNKEITGSIRETYKPSLVHHIRQVNPNVELSVATQIVDYSHDMGDRFAIDPKLLLAVAQVESNFYQYAISTSGALGLMQVIPKWHKDKIYVARKELGSPELFNIRTNFYLGSWTLQDCMTKHNGAIKKALMCYSGNTPQYDKKVIKVYNELIRL